MTDHEGLSKEEFDKLIDIYMDINPKNIKLDLDYDSEPVLTVTLVTKVLFRSITDKNAEKDLQNEGENENDPNNFDKCHLIPVPTIQYLNGRQPSEINPAKIKKLNAKDSNEEKEKFAELMKKAYNHVNPELKTLPDSSTKEKLDNLKGEARPDDFKLDLFQATQRYTFKVPVRKWSTAAKAFPVDLHRIRFSFGLKPIFAYTDSDKTSYEVMIPNRKSTGKARPAKENFYPKIKVKKFPHNADNLVEETILEFDVHPKTLKIFETHPREPVTKKINFVISFLMVRHVLGPALNTLVPIYVIAFLTPFTCFFDLEGTFDDIAGYLVTLLLALVAHRIVITEAQTAIQKFTISDFDFAICTLIIVLQMIIFVIISSFIKIDDIDEQVETILGVDLQLGSAQILFFVEESIIILWILIRILQIVQAFNRLVHENELDLLETANELSIPEYRQLRADRKALASDLEEKVYLKSFFSTNLKILFQNALKPNDSNHQLIGSKLPTNDVYRCRFYQNEQADLALAKIKADNRFTLVYTDTIPKRTTKGNESNTDASETDVSQARAAKAVYSYSPAKGKTLLLEVQFLKDKTAFTVESHVEYKEKKIAAGLNVLQKHESTRLTKFKVINMYLKSLYVEIFSFYKHNFWSKCASDRQLLSLMLSHLNEPEFSHINSTDDSQKDKKSKELASQEIKNLLETGTFETSKHDPDVGVKDGPKPDADKDFEKEEVEIFFVANDNGEEK